MFQQFENISCLVACIACLLFPADAFGQIAEHRIINQLDLNEYGAHPKISKIEQDKLGFIWMASDLGLYRFDGVHVRHFTKTDYPDLPSNNIRSILINYDGKLLIATEEGMVVMDTENEVIEPFPLEFDNETFDSLTPTYLFMASDSTIWMGLSNNEIARLNPGNKIQVGKFEVEGFPLGSCFEVMRILEHEQGDIMVQAICAHRVVFVYVKNLNFGPSANLVRLEEVSTAQMFGNDKEVYLMDFAGFHVFNAKSQKFDQFSDESFYESARPWTIEEYGEKSFLLGDRFGLLERFTITSDSISKQYVGKIADASVQDILTDRSGCTWLGTDDGVYYFADRNPRFTNHLAAKISDERYGIKTRAIVEDWQGRIYACTSQGLIQFIPGSSVDKLEKYNQWNVTNPYSMCVGDKNFLWVGSDGYGLMKFNTQEGKRYDLITATANVDQLGGVWVGELVRDSDSTLWVGTSNGISYSLKNDSNFHIALDFNNKRLLPNTYVHDIKELRKGQYLLGTNHGLYQLTQMGRQPEWHFLLSQYRDVPYKIREICLTSETDIWLATEDAGLVHYDPVRNKQMRYTESNGLPSDVLYSLLPGPKGELWIGTFDGLARFDTTTQLMSNFFVIDGLPSNEFNSQSQLIASDGTFYMGTQNGVVSFRPEEFGIDSSSLPVLIHSVVLHNTRLDSTYTESRYSRITDRVYIGPHDNLVTIGYSIADYTKPSGNRFQYLLEGLYTDWHYMGNQTELVLPHLPAGDYTLRIRGAGSDGRWSTQEARIPISVYAAYYNTWWFRLSVIAALAAIMWLIHWYRLSQLLKLQKMRLRISEDLHDELGSSLTGISIQTELLTASEPSSTRASKLQEISGYIQDAVSKLGDIVWSLQSDTGSLGKLMDRVEEQTHVMLDPSEVECHISLTREYSQLQLREEVMQNCFLIFKEALTNIVKHSNADKVEILVHYLEKGLLLVIADNGHTLSKDHSNKGGNGLRNMHRRANKIAGRLEISNNDGFRIELLVPKAFAG